jgi:hypothetical protein
LSFVNTYFLIPTEHWVLVHSFQILKISPHSLDISDNKMLASTLSILVMVATGYGHTGAFAPGMYCRNGATNVDSPNTNTVVNPLFGLAKKDWWMQADRGCPNYPPSDGEFLEIPAGGKFSVELAHNRFSDPSSC